MGPLACQRTNIYLKRLTHRHLFSQKLDEILAKYDTSHQVICLKAEYNEIVKYLIDKAAGISLAEKRS